MDDMQRKLALIDRELAGRTNLHKRIIDTSPLLFAAAGLMIGILVQDTFAMSMTLWVLLLAACSIAAFVLRSQESEVRSQNSVLCLRITAYISLVCFLCLGAVRLASFHRPGPDDIGNFVSDEQRLATIRGLIITEPYTNNYGYTVEPNRPKDANEIDRSEDYTVEYTQWKFAKFMHSDPSSSFHLKVKEVETIDGWAKISGNIRVQVDEPVLDLKAGDYIQAYCWLDKLKEPTNPGQFNVAKYLACRNVFVAASVKSRSAIEVLTPEPKNILAKIKRTLREKATLALLGSPVPESESEGLLQALLLGYRGDIDNRTYEAFRKTGLVHIISLSGMHLGIFIGAVWWLCKTAGLMKPARAVICIIAIGVFLLIVPPRAPTVRAAIIGWVFCASFLFRRQSNALNTLSLAAVILLLIRPTELFEAGWQLSFASVLGIILFADRIYFLIYQKITNISWFRKGPESRLFVRIITELGRYIFGMFSVGLAAWLAGAGILLYHFYTINPLTSIWTIVAFPFVAVILIFGYLKITLSFLLPTVAMLLGIIVNFLSDRLILIVQCIAGWHIADWNISQVLIGHVSLALVILYYGFIAFATFTHFRRPLLKKAICAGMILPIIVFLGAAKWQRTSRDNVILTCLDVGHGQAILAQLPGKANVLFDAGSMHKSDIGRRIVAPFLDYSGISKIDAIIISHNDVDHINGILEIVEHCDVNGVYANEAFLTAAKADPNDTAGTLKAALSKEGLEIQHLGKDLNLGSKAKITIIWPSEQICRNEELSDNDKSVVSLIEFDGRKVLLCSDIEKFAQQELLRLFPDLKANIVVAPHHGLAKSSQAKFLESLDPDILIYSCGQSQYEEAERAFGSVTPNPNKAKSFYTARNGAITVCIKKDGTVRVTTFVGAADTQNQQK
jgi:competence protein ComEC